MLSLSSSWGRLLRMDEACLLFGESGKGIESSGRLRTPGKQGLGAESLMHVRKQIAHDGTPHLQHFPQYDEKHQPTPLS